MKKIALLLIAIGLIGCSTQVKTPQEKQKLPESQEITESQEYEWILLKDNQKMYVSIGASTYEISKAYKTEYRAFRQYLDSNIYVVEVKYTQPSEDYYIDVFAGNTVSYYLRTI